MNSKQTKQSIGNQTAGNKDNNKNKTKKEKNDVVHGAVAVESLV